MSAVTPVDFAAKEAPYSAYKTQERQQAAAARAWDIWTPERIYADLPAVDWLVEGMIPAGSLGMICAYGSSLKSWIEIDLLDAGARGRSWLGLFPAKQVGAFLVDYEAGQFELRRRLQAVARGLSPDGLLEPAPNLRFVTMPPTFLPEDGFVAQLEEAANGCRLIFIDTLAAGSPGVDENDARFAMPLQRLKALAERTGSAVIALHHTRKPTEGEDERASTRGTSAIYNALDWELKLSRSKDDERRFVVRCTKSRNMRSPDPFTVRVDDIATDAVRVVGELLGPARGASAKDAEKSALQRKRIVELEAAILRVVVETGASGERGLSAALRGRGVAFKTEDLRAAIHNVRAGGRVVEDGTLQRPRWRVSGGGQ